MLFITTQYSLWFLPVCLIAGFMYAWFLYRKDEKLNEASQFLKILMSVFRFLSVSIIAFLLLSPFLKNFGKTIEKPIIIYAQDNSLSVKEDEKNIFRIKEKLNQAFKQSDNYVFKTYKFDQNTENSDSFDFSGKLSNISQAISEIKDKNYNKNIGALILVSDGIYNSGTDPTYIADNLNFPVYTLALGDTNIRKDLILKDVKYNKTSFLNTNFPLRIKIEANKLKNKNTEIKIFDKGKLIKTQKIKIPSNKFYKYYDFKIPAKKTGFHKFKIQLSGIKDEITLKNNSKEIIIEVSDKKQKILILSDAPHPDIAAIKQALKVNQNLETEYSSSAKFKQNINKFNLIILNQLPSKSDAAPTLMKQILNSNIPVIYMLGGNSSLAAFDNLNTGLTTGAYDNAPDEVSGKLNNAFNLFQVNPEIETITMNAPPLISPFGDYKLSSANEILFYRTVKNINTNLPLFVFFTSGNHKNAVITGEGIWRWRIYDYKSNKNHYLFNELINNMVQYMISKDIKSRFEIDYEKIVPENQDVVFTAHTFDKDFHFTEVKNIKFELTDSLKQKIPDLKFKKQADSYVLNLGKPALGDYLWSAETIINGKKYKKSGLFSVIPVKTEYLTTKANHKVLYKISEKTNGSFFHKNQISELISAIKSNENIKPVSYTEKKTEALINFKLIFFIILLLLTAEWFLRKYFGSL